MPLRTLAVITVTALTMSACSSGGDPEADAAFCEATSEWGEALNILGSQMSALGSVSDGTEDPTDPDKVAMMHQIGSDLLTQEAVARAFSEEAMANTRDQAVIDAIEEVNAYTVDIARAMGEDALAAEDLLAFTGLILEDYELYTGMAEFDMTATMTVISDYAQPICQTD